ncbi:MAG: TIGR01212 family radical SAM protein [Candidatus Marinimicrobia bacterium]|nr:TIGR01212 family radical SAM protein [Candidatus Neomarinimicrobiota bacterium]
MKKPYNDYHTYMKEQFGEKTYKVSIRGGFTCPNIDGTVAKGGCTYCNNASFVPAHLKRSMDVHEQINKSVGFMRRRYGADKFLAYFQSYSNTYDEITRLRKLYSEALSHESIHGLVVGTRADCVPEPVLALLEQLAEKYYVSVEYGIESIADETLKRINRGHDFATLVDAVERSQNRGLHIGSHLILGFPWEDRRQWLDTAEVVSDLGVEYLKIHHLQIVKGTELARQHQEDPFNLFEYPEWIQLVCDFLERLSPEVIVGRLAAGTPPRMLVAPKWDGVRHTNVIQDVIREMNRRGTEQGSRYHKEQAA